MKTLHSEHAPKAVGPYSQAIKTGNLLFCSGQIGLNPETMKLVEGGVEKETEQVFKNISAVIEEAGLQKENIVKVLVLLANIDDFTKVNKIYSEYFGEHKPARSCFAVKDLPLGAQVEIEVTAEFE